MVIFSLKTGLPGYFTSFISYLGFLITIQYIPQYTTIMFLSIVGGSIASVIGNFGGPGSTAIYSESYMNNKPSLTQYYIGQEIRFNVFILGFWIPLVLVLRLVMPNAWEALNMAQYALAVEYMIPRLIQYSISKFLGTPGNVLYGANRPNLGIILGVLGSIADLGLKYLYLVYWQIPKNVGLIGTICLLELGYLPIGVITAAISYWFVHTKLVRIRIPWAQMLIGMVIPGGITYFILTLMYDYIFMPIYLSYGFLVALFPAVIALFFILIFGYFPMTGFFGGWDDVNLEECRKAAKMSGPSKFIVWPMYLLINKMCKISPLHNKFALPMEAVVRDAKELLVLKSKNRELFKEKVLKEEMN